MKKLELLLSIGIIFKNEIRCLERCLTSFQPLKAAFPGQIEIVMADTGSDDGSREVAQRYADILFDFPWINDFSAARNAVMDRCSGKWWLAVDADEWLDRDISQLCAFLRSCDEAPAHRATIMIRNYANAALDWDYAESSAGRMLRLSSGARYAGKVHEQFVLPEGQDGTIYLGKVLLHHDGYVCLNDGSDEGARKIARNLALLEEELERNPHNLLLHAQRIDCFGSEYEKLLPYVRQAVEGVKERWEEWDFQGPSILQYAVHTAHMLKLPEFDEWLALAEELFPTSPFTKIDIQYFAAERAWNRMDCAEIVRRGERYLQGLETYRSGSYKPSELAVGVLSTVRPNVLHSWIPYMSRAYLYVGQPEKAAELLDSIECLYIKPEQIRDMANTLLYLQQLSRIDTAPLVLKIWAQINRPTPSKEKAAQRRADFLNACAQFFAPEFLENETARLVDPSLPPVPGVAGAAETEIQSALPVCRHAYTLFLPLEGQCEFGAAAAILETDNPVRIKELLMDVQRMQGLPISALLHTLECGVPFPLKEKPLDMEVMDSLAGRLVHAKEEAIQWAADTDVDAAGQDPQALCWARGLVLAAVQGFPWAREDADGNQGLALARCFARLERVFLPRCYAKQALCPDGLFLLPPMHRFGWYCAQAFGMLDAGDAAGCVQNLRKGLESCTSMGSMVEFLIQNTPELQAPPPSAELLTLAEQIRTILAAYSPNDPAVVALKQSDAYQKVAFLIEGLEPPIAGGQSQ